MAQSRYVARIKETRNSYEVHLVKSLWKPKCKFEYIRILKRTGDKDVKQI